jgi:hypothetical protein
MSKIVTEFLKGGTSKQWKSVHQKGWSYIGRFMWGFAIVESCIDSIFEELFNLNAAAMLMFVGNLDLRKKLDLVALGLKHQGIDKSTILKSVHELHNVRNVIVHACFNYDHQGITFDYVDRSGEMRLPNKKKFRTIWGEEAWDTTITYSEFDLYDAQASKLADALEEIRGSFTPITDLDADLASDIEATIGTSDNVIRFPGRPPRK